jgi:LacI family transcriptional regulator
METKTLGLFMSPATLNDRNTMRGVVDFVQGRPDWRLDPRCGVFCLPWDVASRKYDEKEKLLRRWRGAGVVTDVWDEREYRLLARKRNPSVNIISRVETPRLAAVVPDNRAIGRQAARFFLELGARQFACLLRQELFHDRERSVGFTEELNSAGFACQIIELRGNRVSPFDATIQSQVIRVLKSLVFPLGLFASHDSLGILALESCRHLGAQVPDQVSVLGVGNAELQCEMGRPPLSSISLRGRETGLLAGRLLDQIITGEAERDTKILLPAAEIIKRRSTDFLAIEDEIVREAVKFIRSRFVFPITVEDVTARACTSRRTLDSRFVKALGRTPFQEICRLRIGRAEELLVNSREQIATIAMKSGFGSISTFNRLFFETTGSTPRQYRGRTAASRDDVTGRADFDQRCKQR